MAGRRVLITGVGSHVGSLLAQRLERDPDVEHVAGLDTRRPKVTLDRTEFIEADIRDPEIARLIPAPAPTPWSTSRSCASPARGCRRAMHDINVIGTLQLLAACERVPTLRTIVVRGSAGIYGAEPHAPQFFKEEMARLFPLRTRFQRDVAEIENYFETYARRHPGVSCTMLRYQPAIGRGLRTQITRYLTQPVCPTYMGFDPRIQLVDIEDALEALVAAVRNPVPGAVNVAGPGTIGLSRMIRLAGRRALPIASPLFGAITSTGQRLGLDSQSEDFQRLLRYGRGVDTRRLVEEVGYTPRHSTVHAVESWAAAGEGGGVNSATAIAFMRRLRAGLDSGLELPEALTRGATALPRDARDAQPDRRPPGRRLRRGRGFDEEFAELVEPFFAFLYESWWRVQVEGAERARARPRSSPPTTPASCPGTPR